MFKATIEIDDRQLKAAFNRLTNDVPSRDLMGEIGQEAASLVDLTFVESKDPWGRPWEPLKFRDGQPLLDTGTHLASTVNHKVDGDDSVTVGVAASFAATHQFGATIKPKSAKRLVFQPRGFPHPIFAKQVTIPARPFMPIREGGNTDLPGDWRDSLEQIVTDHIEKILANDIDRRAA